MTSNDPSPSNPSRHLGVPTKPSTSGASEHLHELWKQAVDEYELGLSSEERAALRQRNSPEEVFDLSKRGWEANVVGKRGKYHDKAVWTVSQVLGVFDVVDRVLGLASAVLSQKRNSQLIQ